MAVVLLDDARKQALASLKRFCSTELEFEIRDLQSIALLDFFLKEIAPSVYNGAVSDAQTWLRDRVADLGEPGDVRAAASGVPRESCRSKRAETPGGLHAPRH